MSLFTASLLITSPASVSSSVLLWTDTPCPISLDANGLSSPGGFIPTARMAQGFSRSQEGYNAASGGAEALGGTTAGSIASGLLFGKSGTAQWEPTNPQMTEGVERRLYPNP